MIRVQKLKRCCLNCNMGFNIYPSEDRPNKGSKRQYCSRQCYKELKLKNRQTCKQRNEKQYAYQRANPEKYALIRKRHKQKHLTEISALDRVRARTRYYASKGKIKPKVACEKCGSDRDLQYHHPNYDVFEIQVLCRRCHRHTPAISKGILKGKRIYDERQILVEAVCSVCNKVFKFYKKKGITGKFCSRICNLIKVREKRLLK